MNKKKHTSFVLHHDFESMFRRLPMEERGMLITAIFEYCVRGHETEELSDATGMAFCCIKQVLERDQAAYEERCKANSENGKKGGRPQKNTSPVKSDWFSQKAKKGDSDSDNDNDNDNDNDSDSDSDSDSVSGSGSGSDFYFASASSPAPSSASCTPSAPPMSSAAPQREEEEEALFQRGVPRDYVSARWDRAQSYAEAHGGSVKDVLLLWWQEDQKKHTHKKRAPPNPNKSYDLEDFFEAALARSYANLGNV